QDGQHHGAAGAVLGEVGDEAAGCVVVGLVGDEAHDLQFVGGHAVGRHPAAADVHAGREDGAVDGGHRLDGGVAFDDDALQLLEVDGVRHAVVDVAGAERAV